MKTLKKIASLLLVLLLIMSVTTAVSAAADNKVSISKDGCTFTAYRVLDATNIGDDGNGNDLYSYTVNSNYTGFFTTSEYTYDLTNGIKKGADVLVATANDALDGTGDKTVNNTAMMQLAVALANYTNDNSISGTELTSSTNLDDGYYLIVETDSKDAEGTKVVASKPILVSLKGDETKTVTPKDSSIDLEKKIVENQGTENETLVDANDVNIGDYVYYQIKTAFPVYEYSNLDPTSLCFELTDTFSAGLTYDETTGITVTTPTGLVEKDTADGAGDYFVSFNSSTRELVITFDSKTVYNKMGQELKIRYRAMLNNDAQVNSTTGNPNEVELKFTNNPRETNSYNTLKDDVKTYTYQFKIRKVDKTTTEDLAGAEFKISDANGNEIAKYVYNTEGVPVVTYTSTANDKIKVEVVGAYVTVKGVDAGSYKITETKPPRDYSLISGDIDITIEAINDETTGLPTGHARIDTSALSEVAEIRTNERSTREDADGSIDIVVTIKDMKGISLPETGSTEARILICCGIGAFVLAACFILLGFVFRKRSRSAC